MITLKEICKKYGYSSTHFRTLLCRPEFNQFRIPSNKYFIFDDSDNFHKMLKFALNLRKYKKCIIIFTLLLNTQIAFCQRYEPVIIYSPSGEPQSMIKGKIIYNNFGLPKKYSTNGGYTK